MRINRYLAKCNLGSRRDVEKLIIGGEISVNNSKCTDLSRDIKAGIDVVRYRGEIVTPVEEKLYLALNKPKGYIVSKRDEYERETVFDLLPKFKVDIFAVGRLDKDSEGLLLLTNDGDFANIVMHPRYKFSKIYKVEVKGKITHRDLHSLQDGMLIDRQKTLPARVFVKKSDSESTVLRFTIYEGKNRQIRRMLETLGYKVISLKRLQIAGIKLRELPPGEYRPLKRSEISSILTEPENKRKGRFDKDRESLYERKISPKKSKKNDSSSPWRKVIRDFKKYDS